jgi:hypothetical protein
MLTRGNDQPFIREDQWIGESAVLTLSADRTEPAFSLSLSSRRSRPRPRRHRGRSRRTRGIRRGRCLLTCSTLSRSTTPVSRATPRRCLHIPTSRRHLILRLHDRPTRTKLDHIQRAFLACYEVAAREEHDLARRGKTDEAFGGRFVFCYVLARRGGGCCHRGVGVGIGFGSGWDWGGGSDRMGGRRREPINLVQMEGVWTNLRSVSLCIEHEHVSYSQ